MQFSDPNYVAFVFTWKLKCFLLRMQFSDPTYVGTLKHVIYTEISTY